MSTNADRSQTTPPLAEWDAWLDGSGSTNLFREFLWLVRRGRWDRDGSVVTIHASSWCVTCANNRATA